MISAISAAGIQNPNLYRKKQVSFGSRGAVRAVCKLMEEESAKILKENSGISGLELYRKLIQHFIPAKEMSGYKNSSFNATEAETGIMDRIAEKHGLSPEIKQKLMGLLVEDGKIVGNKTLLDRFTPDVSFVMPSETDEKVSKAFEIALYHVLGVKSEAGPSWTWCPVIASLRDEAIKLTGAKGTYTGAEIAGIIRSSK